jgi:hypothetical protein
MLPMDYARVAQAVQQVPGRPVRQVAQVVPRARRVAPVALVCPVLQVRRVLQAALLCPVHRVAPPLRVPRLLRVRRVAPLALGNPPAPLLPGGPLGLALLGTQEALAVQGGPGGPGGSRGRKLNAGAFACAPAFVAAAAGATPAAVTIPPTARAATCVGEMKPRNPGRLHQPCAAKRIWWCGKTAVKGFTFPAGSVLRSGHGR